MSKFFNELAKIIYVLISVLFFFQCTENKNSIHTTINLNTKYAFTIDNSELVENTLVSSTLISDTAINTQIIKYYKVFLIPKSQFNSKQCIELMIDFKRMSASQKPFIIYTYQNKYDINNCLNRKLRYKKYAMNGVFKDSFMTNELDSNVKNLLVFVGFTEKLEKPLTFTIELRQIAAKLNGDLHGIIVLDNVIKYPHLAQYKNGGDDGFYKFLGNYLEGRYPINCLNKNISHNLILRFTISRSGKISDIVVLNPNKECPEFNALASEALLASGLWIPARNKEGKFISSKRNIAIKFTMAED